MQTLKVSSGYRVTRTSPFDINQATDKFLANSFSLFTPKGREKKCDKTNRVGRGTLSNSL